MKINIVIFIFFFLTYTPAFCFDGDYNSSTGYDSALIIAVKQQSDISFKFEDDSSIDINRKIFLIGLSKTIDSRTKIFGAMSYALDGEIESVKYDLESGYYASAGVSYAFIGQDTYAVSGFAQLDYIINDEYKDTQFNREYSIDGYGILTGLLAKYSIGYNISVHAAVQLLLFSAFSENRSWGENLDIEMDDTVSGKFGFNYDEDSWFLKAEYESGMGTGFGLYGGIKF